MTLPNSTTQDQLTLLAEDFHVRILALQTTWQKELPENAAVFGLKCTALLGKLSPASPSLKTAHYSLGEDLKPSYKTWPKSGIMLNGNVYQTATLVIRTKEKGFTLLPTPVKSDSKHTYKQMDVLTRYLGNGHQRSIVNILTQRGFTKYQRLMILETVMGFNIGHTELKPLVIA